MPTVTALEPQRRDKDRINVYLDGVFGFGASLLLPAVRALHVGLELTEQDVTLLSVQDDGEKAYSSALRFLGHRPRSAREIRDNLRAKKFDAGPIERVMERLAENGFVDDQAFAQYWLENRQTFRPRGSRALRMELIQKGVPRDVIEETLSSVTDEEGSAYVAGSTKARGLNADDEQEFLHRLTGYLRRRGFDYDVSLSAAKRLYSEKAGGPDTL